MAYNKADFVFKAARLTIFIKEDGTIAQAIVEGQAAPSAFPIASLNMPQGVLIDPASIGLAPEKLAAITDIVLDGCCEEANKQFPKETKKLSL